jgi:hypothetical protein
MINGFGIENLSPALQAIARVSSERQEFYGWATAPKIIKFFGLNWKKATRLYIVDSLGLYPWTVIYDIRSHKLNLRLNTDDKVIFSAELFANDAMIAATKFYSSGKPLHDLLEELGKLMAVHKELKDVNQVEARVQLENTKGFNPYDMPTKFAIGQLTMMQYSVKKNHGYSIGEYEWYWYYDARLDLGQRKHIKLHLQISYDPDFKDDINSKFTIEVLDGIKDDRLEIEETNRIDQSTSEVIKSLVAAARSAKFISEIENFLADDYPDFIQPLTSALRG